MLIGLGLAAWFAGCRAGGGVPPSDVGGFRADLGSTPGRLVAGESADLEVRVTAGASGLPADGALWLVLPHPWFGAGGTAPQGTDPAAQGHATASAAGRAARVEVLARGVDPVVRARWPGRGLGPGEVVSLRLARVRVQRFTEADWRPRVIVESIPGERFVELVPGEGRAVLPGPPSVLRVGGPSRAEPSAPFTAWVGVEDRFRNPVPGVALRVVPRVLSKDGPSPSPGGRTVTTGSRGEPAELGDLVAGPAGTAWVEVTATLADGTVLSDIGDPVAVARDAPPVRFGDLHGHTALSDGAGTPEEAFAFARDVARVDFAALTEHAWQLDGPAWDRVRRAADDAAAAGRFATLHAFEADVGGHRCVYFDAGEPDDLDFAPGAPRALWEIGIARRSPDPPPRAATRYAPDPSRLYRWLSGRRALVVPHTSASPWMGDGWERVDGAFGHLAEVYSAHGQSEDAALPGAVPGAVPQGAVSTALARGLPLRLVAAGDGHDGHLGRPAWGGHPGGLAAVVAETVDRASIFRALAGGPTYATSGGRPLLRFGAGGVEMGGVGRRTAAVGVRGEYAGDAPIERIELLRDGRVRETWRPRGDSGPAAGLSLDFHLVDEPPPGPVEYRVRVFQRDGARAWSSPVRLVPAGAARVRAVGGALGEDEAGIDLAVDAPPGHRGFRLSRRASDDGRGDPSRYEVVDGAAPARGGALRVRRRYAVPGQPEAWIAEDLGTAGRVVARYGPLWSMPEEAPLPPAPASAPFALRVAGRPGDAVEVTSVEDRRAVMASLPLAAGADPGATGEVTFAPHGPAAASALAFRAPGGDPVRVFLYRLDTPSGWSPWRWVVRRVEDRTRAP